MQSLLHDNDREKREFSEKKRKKKQNPFPSQNENNLQRYHVLSSQAVLLIIYGVISARLCTRTLKTWRICPNIELCQLKNGYSSPTNMGTPPFFPLIAINLS